MKKGFFIILLILGLFSLNRCGPGVIRDQVRFGIWASERDLWDEAIYRWKKAVEEEPGSVAAHNNLAVAYEKKGLWEEAGREYEAALKLAPENNFVKYNFDKFKASRDPAAREKEDTNKGREKRDREGEKGGHGE